MNILINNVHCVYVWMLAHTNHLILVTNPPRSTAWDTRQRDLPANVITLDNAENISNFLELGKERIDRCILQDTFLQGKDGKMDIVDRMLFERINCKKVMLFHNSFQTHFRSVDPEYHNRIKKEINEKLKGIKKVFISKMKQDSWGEVGVGGDIILPFIDVENYGGYKCGDYVLTTCNNFKARDFMNGFVKSMALTNGMLYKLVGEGEGQQGLAPNHGELKKAYQNARVYLCLNNPNFEDGYNLSMLEAMATGVPCVTLDHPTSPIINGVNGFRSNDLNLINKFIKNVTQEELIKLSAGARKTADELYPFEDFIKNWNDALEMP